MRLTPLHSYVSIVETFTPPWTRHIASDLPWQSIIEKNLTLTYIVLSQIKNLKDQHYDVIFLSSTSIPDLAHDFIPLFNALAPGGSIILELGTKSYWKHKQISRLASSMGAKLKFFAAVQQKPDSKLKHTIAVLQKESLPTASKKVSVVIPIYTSIQDKKESTLRVLDWLCFLRDADLLAFVELVVVFDGMQDLLPNWNEYEGLEAEYGFQILRHYRPFGPTECMRSGFYFARGRYILWDHHPIACNELLCLLDHVYASGRKKDIGIFAQAAYNEVKSGQRLGPILPVPFFLCDQKTAHLVYNQINQGQKQESEAMFIKGIVEVLKKHKASVSYATVMAH